MLEEELGGAGPGDVVLVSFAGHGTHDHRLVLFDTARANHLPTTIAMGELAELFARSRAAAVILFLDCCFSGGAPARVLDLGLVPRGPGMPLAVVAGEGRLLFAACRSGQVALEDPRTRHGLFTQAVIRTLLEADAPLPVTRLIDQVIVSVRAEAARLGYEQTPVIFGELGGDLTLPPGRRGSCYAEAFPEHSGVRTSGAFSDLAAAGIAEPVLQAWRERYPGGLNSLQIAAVNEHRVMDGAALCVVAPTSAGKTFIGEMAAMKAIADGRKAVFVLPFKALVNEKYEDFEDLYSRQLGIRVVRCTGDWQDQVDEFGRGRYDIAFLTTEKLLGMLLAAPYLLNQVGLLVVDEAQFISDASRGMALELLLTNVVTARQRGISPQLVALSAVIDDTNHFENWLGCGLLRTTERPVPLVEGVLDRTGTFQFMDLDGDVRTQALLSRDAIRQRRAKPSSQDVLVPLVKNLVDQGEKVIVFRGVRGNTTGSANYLAQELGLPSASDVLASLPEGDPSATSNALREVLSKGVAFHSSDLSREERVAVERGFRNPIGPVKVLVATSTVAAGINTPASTVVIVETERRGGEGAKPFSVAEVKNMAGRAGRLGYEPSGRAIILADTSLERQQLFRRYVAGRPEPVRSSFDPRRPGTWILRLLARPEGVRREDLPGLVANTYGGYVAELHDPGWRTRAEQFVASIAEALLREELVEEESNLLRLTMLGRACAESPLTLESSLRLIGLLKALPEPSLPLEHLLVVLEALTERDEDYTPQNRGNEPRWQRDATERFGQPIVRLLRRQAASDTVFYARCKRALIVADWLAGMPLVDIETAYTTNPYGGPVRSGDVRGFADGTRLLLDASARIANIVLGTGDDGTELRMMLRRLELGIPADIVRLPELRVPLTRADLLTLRREGLTTPEAIAATAPDRLRDLTSRSATALHVGATAFVEAKQPGVA